MYRGKSTAVVIPAYNEAAHVGEVLDTLPTFVDRAYVVDDCSSDGTWEEIEERVERAERRSPHADGGTRTCRIVPIRHATNKGVGGAIKTGYGESLKDGMDVTAVMAGDGQMDPEILDRIIDPVVEGRADYAKGDRLRTSAQRAEMTTWRFIGNAILTFLTKIASGYLSLNDPQNGYTAISRRSLEVLDLDSLYDGYGFSNDLLVRLNSHGLRVTDVEMRARYGDEGSHIRYGSFIPRLSFLLVRGFLWRLKAKYVVRDFHPLVLFYSLGCLGLLFTLGAATTMVLDGQNRMTVLLTLAVLFLISALAIAWAMIFDRRYTLGHE